MAAVKVRPSGSLLLRLATLIEVTSASSSSITPAASSSSAFGSSCGALPSCTRPLRTMRSRSEASFFCKSPRSSRASASFILPSLEATMASWCRRTRTPGTPSWAAPRLLLLRHCRGMMARDEPLRTVPAIGVGVAPADLCPCLGKREGVKPGIDRRVATKLNGAQVDRARGAVLQEVMEVVFLLGRRETRLVRHRGQEDGSLCVVGEHLVRINRLQRLIPSIEQRGDFLFCRCLAGLHARALRRTGAAGKRCGDHQQAQRLGLHCALLVVCGQLRAAPRRRPSRPSGTAAITWL